jgi:hypothetical protein
MLLEDDKVHAPAVQAGVMFSEVEAKLYARCRRNIEAVEVEIVRAAAEPAEPDEAAVERAARFLYLSPWANQGFPVKWEEENEGHKDMWRERAAEFIAALRAAGESQ